jgi:two-component system response regulator QseB
MRLLLVEDDASVGDGLQRALRADNYTVDWVVRGDQVLPALAREHFDLVLLDIGLPGLDGLQVLKRLRSSENPIPVIVISARETFSDRIAGLDSGADDYITKPFDLDELRARIRACLRRPVGEHQEELLFADLRICPDSMEVWRADERITLSRREFSLLLELVRSRGRVLTRERLEQAMYGWEGDVESNALEVHIHHLRKKFGGNLIRTVRGVGYSMVEE